MWKPGPAWPWKTGLAQAWPEWTGDFGQLYIAIKLASSKCTFLLAPPKQADTIIICIPQGEKGTISFKSGEGEMTLIEVTEAWTANREQMQAVEQAREQKRLPPGAQPESPGWGGQAVVGRAGYLYSPAWVWVTRNNANRRVLGAGTGTGLGLARGWAGTDRILAVCS